MSSPIVSHVKHIRRMSKKSSDDTVNARRSMREQPWSHVCCACVSTEMQGTDECAHNLRLISSSSALPPQYWLTLQSLLRHFSRVCQASAANLLSARALAEIFSPALFRYQPTRYTLAQTRITSQLAIGSNKLTFLSLSLHQLWAQPWSTHQNNWSPGDQWMEWQSGGSR